MRPAPIIFLGLAALASLAPSPGRALETRLSGGALLGAAFPTGAWRGHPLGGPFLGTGAGVTLTFASEIGNWRLREDLGFADLGTAGYEAAMAARGGGTSAHARLYSAEAGLDHLFRFRAFIGSVGLGFGVMKPDVGETTGGVPVDLGVPSTAPSVSVRLAGLWRLGLADAGLSFRFAGASPSLHRLDGSSVPIWLATIGLECRASFLESP
jgi:hypothetical protein